MKGAPGKERLSQNLIKEGLNDDTRCGGFASRPGVHVTILNLDETREWLEIVYGDAPGYLHICSTGDWDGQTFESGDIDKAISYVGLLNAMKREGIYARACTLRQPPTKGRRGGDDQSFFFPGLWADIDIKGPGHKTTQPLPPSEDEAMQIVQAAGLPAPSHWIHSGGGLYAWWLLHDAVEIDDLESFRALSSGWQKCLEHGAKQLGLHYGAGIGDLSRVLRLPGTVNRKAGLERPCTALYPHAWSGERFTFNQLVNAMVAATPPPPPAPVLPAPRYEGEQRPGDAYNAMMQWQDVLPGWTWVYRRGDKWHLRRPGKDRDVSATISLTTDRFYPFTDAAPPFEQNKHYSKFEAFTLLEHGGNFSAAASFLARQGLGSRRDPFASGALEVPVAYPRPVAQAAVANPSLGDTELAHPQATHSQATMVDRYGIPMFDSSVFKDLHRWDGHGFADAYTAMYKDVFRYVGSDKVWMHFDGKIWNRAERGRETLAAQLLTRRMMDYVKMMPEDGDGGETKKALLRKVERMTHDNGVAGLVRSARVRGEIAADWEDFDTKRNLVTLDNGVLDLDTLELLPHNPNFMLTRKVNASYDPDEKQGRFTRFMEEVLPDQQVREYLQRVCGYALTGEADSRVLIQLYGPSGSGKTQFTKALFKVMGDFGKRSSDSAFQARPNSYKGPSEDLHSLMGSRFAMMPELDEGFRLNVSLIKALTGGDPLTTRKLYGQEVSWRPEFTVFMITNHLPRVAAGEEAYWNRVKPIKFGQVFVDSMGEALNSDDRNLGERMAAEEPEVILNWVLEGLKQYRERGLDAPEQIAAWRDEYRDDVDTVRQFLAEAPGEGRIVKEEKATVTVRPLHLAYTAWCSDNQVPALGMRKFNERMEAVGFERHRKEGGITWFGIGLAGMIGEATTSQRASWRSGGYEYSRLRQ